MPFASSLSARLRFLMPRCFAAAPAYAAAFAAASRRISDIAFFAALNSQIAALLRHAIFASAIRRARSPWLSLSQLLSISFSPLAELFTATITPDIFFAISRHADFLRHYDFARFHSIFHAATPVNARPFRFCCFSHFRRRFRRPPFFFLRLPHFCAAIRRRRLFRWPFRRFSPASHAADCRLFAIEIIATIRFSPYFRRCAFTPMPPAFADSRLSPPFRHFADYFACCAGLLRRWPLRHCCCHSQLSYAIRRRYFIIVAAGQIRRRALTFRRFGHAFSCHSRYFRAAAD